MPLADVLAALSVWDLRGVRSGIEGDPRDGRPAAAGAPLRVAAAHPVTGVADGHDDIPCLLLELEGLRGEAFVLLWYRMEINGQPAPRASVFPRVHAHEAMG